MASLLFLTTIVSPEAALMAQDAVTPISGDYEIVTDGMYEIIDTERTPMEIEIADGVTEVSLQQNNSDTVNAVIVTNNSTSLQLTIEGLQLTSHSPIQLLGSGEVRLILVEENILIADASTAGVAVEGDAKLVISGEGSLVAQGGIGAAGIGGSPYGNTGTIEIEEGTITALGGGDSGVFSGGAGIGSGRLGSTSEITLHGGFIRAEGASGGAGIGGGALGDNAMITINEGVIHAIGSNGGAGIGGGGGAESDTINIHGGRITAIGGYLEYNGQLSGAGIGGGYNSSGGDITITGGQVSAEGGQAIAAGIGGGAIYIEGNYSTQSADIQLQGGIVFSTPGYNGERFSGLFPEGEGPSLLTLEFIETINGESSPVAETDISVKKNIVRTDANGMLYLYVPEDNYTLEDFEFTGSDGYRALSMIPETIQVASQQSNQGVIEWSDRHQVNWHLAGGTMDDTAAVTDAEDGASIDAPSPSPLRNGYTFSGWYIDEMYTTKAQFPFVVEQNTDFYAAWTSSSLYLPEAEMVTGIYNEPYNASIPAATDGTGNYTYELSRGSLPDGFTLNERTIEGMAEKAGRYEFEVKATDLGSGNIIEQGYVIEVKQAVPVPIHEVKADRLQRREPLRQATLTGEFQHTTTGELVPGSLAWVEPTFVPTQNRSNQDWVFTPTDQFNYSEVKGNAIVTFSARSASSSDEDSSLSSNANLAELQLLADGQELELSPSFASGTTEYTARTNVGKIEIAVKTADPSAKVYLGDEEEDDQFIIDLDEGINRITLTVQAENDRKKNYKVTITRDMSKQQESDVNAPELDEPSRGPANPVAGFTDISGHWAENAIHQAAFSGMINGYLDGSFRPNESITRAEFTVMLMKSGNMKREATAHERLFADQNQIEPWAKEAVSRAVQNGIVYGYEDNSFRPNAPLTRAEIAVMIARALKLQADTKLLNPFTDNNEIPEWASDEVEGIRNLGVIDGRSGNRFVPNGITSRAEATVMLQRALELEFNER
ncbi:putative repeat protein (TIGR02543 family) [Aureibacillus halotolerans]|uniref:Putative repeat protein (TIGR02543 family) n=1 Tax=Aureibacillus halotolerans TaxID=1508390 RepID=A0A4R6U4H5_9BACI|nr:putative repeat protein (TIGR02543 family) [Aureibacillus halotolerans]